MSTSPTPPTTTPATIQIADYQPHPRNYNGHPDRQIERIAASLRKFGQVRPIVTWRRYIIAGHGVVIAARSLGWTEIAAAMLPDDYPEHLALAYLAADNELARMGDPDQAALAAILEDSRAVDAELLQAIGYDDRELGALIAAVASADKDDRHTSDRVDEEAGRALQAKWGTDTGQLWQLGGSLLMCGDSTDPAALSALMAGRTADLMIADPPYNVGIDYASADVDDKQSAESYEAFTRAWFEQWRAVAIRAIVTPGYNNLATWARLYEKRIKQIAPWTKANSMVRGYISRFACWEPVLFFGEADPEWEPVLFIDGDRPPRGEKWQRVRNNDIFNYPVGNSDPINLHPCPKPPAMITDMINSYTDPGDLVIDPFSGSGTTLIVAERMIRRAAVMEINPIWVASALQRYHDATGDTPRRIDA